MKRPEPVIVLRKPTDSADRYVSSGVASEVPAATTPIIPIMAPPAPAEFGSSVELVARRRTIIGRRDGRALHRTTIYLPPDLSRRLAQHCAELGKSQSDVISGLVADHLSGSVRSGQ